MQKKNTPSPQTPSLKWLVSIIVLSLLAIFSTLLPSDIQQRNIMGLPLILYFWWGTSGVLAALIATAAWHLTREG